MNRFYLLYILFALILVGCDSPAVRPIVRSETFKATPTPLSTKTPLPSATPNFEEYAFADCGYSAIGKAWLDINTNGIWDDDEVPLSGVRFFVDDIYNRFRRVNDEAITDQNGQAFINVFLPGCPTYKFEIYTVMEPKYRLTTPARLDVEESDFEAVL